MLNENTSSAVLNLNAPVYDKTDEQLLVTQEDTASGSQCCTFLGPSVGPPTLQAR
jgi:hypothetical protein